jgi:predicted RNase H-like HicB family nuclease
MRFLVIVEEGLTSFGGYVPDLPGCVAVGETRNEALALIRKAIELHLANLHEKGRVIPNPSSTGELAEVPA